MCTQIRKCRGGRLRRSGLLLFGLVVAVLLRCQTAEALTTYDDNDIEVKFKCPCTGEVVTLDVGDLSVTLDNGTDKHGRATGDMTAIFKVSDTIRKQSGPCRLCDCLEFKFYQFITHDNEPASFEGGTPTFPMVDPPLHGWDYMYDNDAYANPAPGFQPEDRVPGNAGAGWLGDVTDEMPWYHTSAEETTWFHACDNYTIWDAPTCCQNQGTIAFTTFLVAVARKTCPNDDNCLKTDQFLLLAGFDWTVIDNEPLLYLGATTLGTAEANSALANAGFTNWTAVTEGIICCKIPEPTVLVLVTAGLGLLGVLRRRRRT